MFKASTGAEVGCGHAVKGAEADARRPSAGGRQQTAGAPRTSRHCPASSREKMLSWGLLSSRLYRQATCLFSSTAGMAIGECVAGWVGSA